MTQLQEKQSQSLSEMVNGQRFCPTQWVLGITSLPLSTRLWTGLWLVGGCHVGLTLTCGDGSLFPSTHTLRPLFWEGTWFSSWLAILLAWFPTSLILLMLSLKSPLKSRPSMSCKLSFMLLYSPFSVRLRTSWCFVVVNWSTSTAASTPEVRWLPDTLAVRSETVGRTATCRVSPFLLFVLLFASPMKRPKATVNVLTKSDVYLEALYQR